MILLTGASGYIGSALKKNFESSFITCATLSSSDFNFFPKLEEIENKITCIIICGGFIPHSSDEVENLAEAEKSNKLLEFLLSNKFPNLIKLIYFSTCDVYTNSAIMDENSKIIGGNLYTQTKIKQEHLVQGYSNNRNISCVILRLGSVYGPGEFKYNKLIPRAIQCAILDDNLVLTVTRKSKIQPIYIDDVTISVRHLAEHYESSAILNLVGVAPISVDDLIYEILKYSELRIIDAIEAIDYSRTYKTEKMLEIFQHNFTSFPQGLKEEFTFETKRLSFC